MTGRERLPNRRNSEVLDFEHGGAQYRASISRNADDEILEVFLDCGKPGSALQSVARDAAVLASIALQYGAPLHVVRHALTRLQDGSAAGPLGRVLDLLAVRER